MALFVSSCVHASGVTPVGANTYMVVGYTNGNPGEAVEHALQAADRYCLRQGLNLVLRHQAGSANRSAWGNVETSSTIVFGCVTQNDPEYRRTTMTTDPAVVVERH